MSNLQKSLSDTQIAVIDTSILESIREFEEAIKVKHKKVSREKTNKNHVKQKAGMDYVEFSYMKNKANEHYPLWSFKNLEIINELITTGWVVVKGELHFLDEGVPRVGAVAAAHRVAFKSGADRTPQNIVDLGNDVKAAVSDAMKKAFNVYMNISDDIYRTIEIEDIDEAQKKILYEMIEKCAESQKLAFYKFVDTNTMKFNFEEIAKKLLGALYKHQEAELNKEEALDIATKFKKRLSKDFEVVFD